jgi:hypothetical protein
VTLLRQTEEFAAGSLVSGCRPLTSPALSSFSLQLSPLIDTTLPFDLHQTSQSLSPPSTQASTTSLVSTREIRFNNFTAFLTAQIKMASAQIEDIQHLLAFIARTQQKPNFHEERLTRKDEIPSNSPIQKNPRRLVPLLDSIANLCVKDPHHEVVAVALRAHNRVELIITTNTNVPQATVNHLNNLWNVLQQLSGDYCAANGVLEQSQKSPPRPDYDSFTTKAWNREELIRRQCLRFAWERLKKGSMASSPDLWLLSVRE